MHVRDEKIASLLRDLPDAEGARRFYERLTIEHRRTAERLARDEGLLSDALALAAWSPLLATTLAQHPDYLTWLARERTDTHVRTTEELGESLARFALTHTQDDTQILLARFRRRELLRIYLHDIRRANTIVETTEELSNLADAVLAYALNLARQELDNRYGAPLCRDARGRKTTASFCIVALGKLGSRELNYASDIDLLFLYSEDGETSGTGERGTTTNREYFNRLAERIARLVGQPTGEGAAYRVDLRLRPHGRVGALSCSLAEAVRYYRETAQAWELQALIRARSAAGASALYARFAAELRERIYVRDATVKRALEHVRLAKQKIDREHGDDARGFNVKLGRGGIREIEFIAQALQLAHGGRDEWLQYAPHTLISLGRLAERALINERERTELSDAYAFLRALEHRLQMEHGLQTHTVPEDVERRALVARRMNFEGDELSALLRAFNRTLDRHTSRVHAAYERIFGGDAGEPIVEEERSDDAAAREVETDTVVAPLSIDEMSASRASVEDAERAAAQAAATVFAPRFATFEREKEDVAIRHLARNLFDSSRLTLNPRRALAYLARVAASLDKSNARVELSLKSLHALVRLCSASEYFGEMIAGHPALIPTLTIDKETVEGRDYRALLRASIDRERSFRAELVALRRTWAQLIIEVGALDAAREIDLRESNRMQTELATASLNAAYFIARREVVRRFGPMQAGPRLSMLGLGRLGSGGMDYGSDLDLVTIYDAHVPSPIAGSTPDEANTRLSELTTTALSSITREGSLYRVDMRLRPDGNNGPLVRSAQSFLEYLAARTDVWEWLAYVKLRAVGGDLELGKMFERQARHVIHEAAQRVGRETLRAETRRVRERLEHERTKKVLHVVDIKFGAGGMLDVYFATRYLQLRDDVRDEGQDRSTAATLARLHEAGSLSLQDFHVLRDGYACLRTLDHFLRFIAGQSSRLPAAIDHPLLADLARIAGYSSVSELQRTLTAHMRDIRAAFERITTA